MKIVRNITIVLGVFVLVVLCIYTYLGGYNNLNFYEKSLGEETVIYQEVTGDYRNSYKMTDEFLNKLQKELNIKINSFYINFNTNPHLSPKVQIKAEIGCIIGNEYLDKLSLIENKYKSKKLAAGKYVILDFPYKGKLSYKVGWFKVYPAIHNYLESKNYETNQALTEIYNIQTNKITYRILIPSKK